MRSEALKLDVHIQFSESNVKCEKTIVIKSVLIQIKYESIKRQFLATFYEKRTGNTFGCQKICYVVKFFFSEIHKNYLHNSCTTEISI